jgi:hypothetical protein
VATGAALSSDADVGSPTQPQLRMADVRVIHLDE